MALRASVSRALLAAVVVVPLLRSLTAPTTQKTSSAALKVAARVVLARSHHPAPAALQQPISAPVLPTSNAAPLAQVEEVVLHHLQVVVERLT